MSVIHCLVKKEIYILNFKIYFSCMQTKFFSYFPIGMYIVNENKIPLKGILDDMCLQSQMYDFS